MMGRIAAGALAALVLGSAACSVIAGKDDPGRNSDAPSVRILYEQTLRNQASLRGMGLQPTDFATDPATSLQRPIGVVADPYRVYVTERSPVPRLAIFDRSDNTLSFVSILPVPDRMQFQFVDPVAIAVDESGLIFVADSAQGKVFGMDRKGGLFFGIGKAGELGAPSGLAVDVRGNRLYVADKSAHRVQAYTLQGSLLYEFRGPDLKQQEKEKEKGLGSPVGIAVDRNGVCYVLDERGNRVVLFDANGSFLRSFRVRSAVRGRTIKPAGIAVDSAGQVYVSDSQNSAILIFGQDGALRQSWGGTGSQQDALWNPAGIFIDGRDYLYIADQMNGRVQVYQLHK